MELPEHPTNEMIRAGVVTLGEHVIVGASLHCGDLSRLNVSDLVETIWLEMARAYPKGARWVEAEPPGVLWSESGTTGSWDLSKVRDNL